MIQNKWMPESRKTTVCIDSYDNGIPVGRLYNSYADPESFESLTQFLLKMEAALDALQLPQSYTSTRSFGQPQLLAESTPLASQAKKGRKATFELQVIFRQHTSWQGTIVWRDQRVEQSFRSVLELVLLMDSALRNVEGCDCA